MNRIANNLKLQRMVRCASAAHDIMTPNPVSIDHTARIQQAAAVLAGRGISAAPVINEAGRPVGVISHTDIVRVAGSDGSEGRCGLSCDDCARYSVFVNDQAADEIDALGCGCPTVADVMTPEVFTVEKDASVVQIVEELLGRDVHRLFVVDDDGVLVGVVTALDVLRSLRR